MAIYFTMDNCNQAIFMDSLPSVTVKIWQEKKKAGNLSRSFKGTASKEIGYLGIGRNKEPRLTVRLPSA